MQPDWSADGSGSGYQAPDFGRVAARCRSTRKRHGGAAGGLSEARWIFVKRLDSRSNRRLIEMSFKRRPRSMKDFWLNDYSGRHERWAADGHRWVAAESGRTGFDLWGYQDDASEVVHLGSGRSEEEPEKLADQFLSGDP
jgi:hypothetical protein